MQMRIIILVILLFSRTMPVAFGSGFAPLVLCNITCTTSYSTGTSINLGNFDPYNYVNVTLPVTLSVSCSGTSALPILCTFSTNLIYSYDLNGGGANNVTARRMSLSSNYLRYKICVDTSCSNQYGDGSNGTTEIGRSFSFVPLSGNTDTYTLYFSVPVQAVAAIGTYLDGVIGTLTYKY